MKISREEVIRVAELAHLELSPEEIDTYRGQLDEILSYIDKLKELDVTSVEPMAQVNIPLVHRRGCRAGESSGTARRRSAPLRCGRRRPRPSGRRREAILPGAQGDRPMSAATSWTVASVREALANKKISARELAAEFYGRIEKRNPELNAYLTLSPERAYEQAGLIDAAIARGEALPPLRAFPSP